MKQTVIVFQAGSQPMSRKDERVDPVVGWLVAHAGPSLGRDFRIRSGTNSIGRADDQDISVGDEDQMIHSDRHAFITYDPQSNHFFLTPGMKRNTTHHMPRYANDESEIGVPKVVLGPVELAPYDIIRMGKSEFIFVPLCSESFQWSFNQGGEGADKETAR